MVLDYILLRDRRCVILQSHTEISELLKTEIFVIISGAIGTTASWFSRLKDIINISNCIFYFSITHE